MKDYNGRKLMVGNMVVAVGECGDYFKRGAVGKVAGFVDDELVTVNFMYGNFLNENVGTWNALPEKLVRV